MLFKKLILILAFTVNPSLAFAEVEAHVLYEHSKNAYEENVQNNLKTSGVVDEALAFINETFSLSKPLIFRFGGDDGPLYDPNSNEILIPYSFIQEVQERYEDANYAETGVSAIDATADALLHTLFHEFAHSLIFIHEIPVVGKEEDAADGLASLLLIEFFGNGAEIAISAADLFDLESEDIEAFDERDFWDEHSLDAQRFYSTLCYVYGSDPVKYSYLKQDAHFSEQRAELCIEEYDNLAASWLLLLKPLLKSNKMPESAE